MAWDSPTLQELRDRFRQDFIARTSTGDAVLRRSVENVLSYVVPGVANGLYGYVDWGVRQLIPSEDGDLDSMLRWANDLLTPPQTPASAAYGTVTFTGTDTTVIPAGTSVTNRDGIEFTTDAIATIGSSVSGEVDVVVTAVDAGIAGNTEAGVSVFLGTPISGVDAEALVATGGLSGGADEETKFGVLSRLRERFKTPPRGGSEGDFVVWAKEASGVSRAYEFRQEPTTGWVTVVIIDDTSGPVPGAGIIAASQAAVDLKRPIMMGGCVVRGPEPQTLNLTWSNVVPLRDQTYAEAQTAIETNVDAYILTQTVPEAVVSQPAIENAGQAVVTSVSLTTPPGDQDPGQYGLYTTINHAYA